MPIKLERQLKQQAKKKFGTTLSERAKRYMYGSLQKYTSWKPGKK